MSFGYAEDDSPLTPPQRPDVQNLGDLNSHRAIARLFIKATTSKGGPKRDIDTVKTTDQFVGMDAFGLLESARPSGSAMKRGSQAVDSGNAGSTSKRSRL